MLTAALTLAVLGGAFGALLTVAYRKLNTNVDPRIDQITDLLPGANCGSCGFAGCRGLATAISKGITGISPCLACAPENKIAIARIMGYNVELSDSPLLRNVCYVACNGCKDQTSRLFDYRGIKDCHLVAKHFGGPGKCNFGCLGFGSCTKVCPFHAISMGENGLPVIDYTKCTGCGLCARQCPQGVLRITSATTRIHLKCNNRDKGKAAMADCAVSCISCGLCARLCPTKAITLREDRNGSIPVIDYAKCTECGLCVSKCPRHCLSDEPLVVVAPEKPAETAPSTSSCASCALAGSCHK